MDEAQKEAGNLGRGSERYFMASVFLSLFVIACISVALNRHFELNSCSLEVKELAKTAGECGKKQVEELESCRNKLYELREQKGKCIVYDE